MSLMDVFVVALVILAGIGMLFIMASLPLIAFTIQSSLNSNPYTFDEAKQCSFYANDAYLEEYSDFYVLGESRIFNKNKYFIYSKKCHLRELYNDFSVFSYSVDSGKNNYGNLTSFQYCQEHSGETWACFKEVD